MSTVEERKHIAEQLNNVLIPACCSGDKSAEAYLKRVFFVVRMIDDLQDGDTPVNKNDIIKGFMMTIADLPNNTFYKKHADMLNGIHLISFNAWRDSNAWEQSDDPSKKMYAHVLRDYICELFVLVAFLTGGEKLMHEVSLQMREMFLKKME